MEMFYFMNIIFLLVLYSYNFFTSIQPIADSTVAQNKSAKKGLVILTLVLKWYCI